jgi:hypothetical protein
MSSRAIVTLFGGSLIFILVAAAVGFLPVYARAESPEGQYGLAPQATAAPQSTAGALSKTGAASSDVPSPAGVAGNATAPNPAASTASAATGPQLDAMWLLTPAQRRTFQRASVAFNSFCHHWEDLLHERELNNLEHLSWRQDGGTETADYTGYGKVQSCVCKASKEGLPIGKISYEENTYSIAGKTTDEARHSSPKITHQVSTIEIFSWDKEKWFY